jgi:hypothetical protein
MNFTEKHPLDSEGVFLQFFDPDNNKRTYGFRHKSFLNLNEGKD